MLENMLGIVFIGMAFIALLMTPLKVKPGTNVKIMKLMFTITIVLFAIYSVAKIWL